jgi:hypothetical protein
MSQQTETKFNEMTWWFEENYGRYPIVDQNMRWNFLIKALQTMMLVQTKLIIDINALEGRGGDPVLYLPSGVRYRSDMAQAG